MTTITVTSKTPHFFVSRFAHTKRDANRLARYAKNAGMTQITVTTTDNLWRVRMYGNATQFCSFLKHEAHCDQGKP